VSKPGNKRRSPAGSRRTSREIPQKESILAVDTLISPKGKRYAVLETDQMDPYDRRSKGRKFRG
jgi:hypothetical protein